MKNNENDDEDRIKTFLKIENSNIPYNKLYTLDLPNNLITLYSPKKEKYEFEFDKIFLEKDENSYIYEIFCLNTIKDCLDGISYSFISFGETPNKKYQFLIGDLIENDKNINSYGVFIRFIDNLLQQKKSKNLDF